MKILIISGDGDFNVISWQESGLSVEDTAKLVEKEDDGIYWHEDGEWSAEIEEYPFTVSDEKAFEDFLSDIKNDHMDYDGLKATELFLIKETN